MVRGALPAAQLGWFEETARLKMVTGTTGILGEVKSEGLTQILNAAAAGDQAAIEYAWSFIYDDVHRMAYHALSHEGPATQLQPTLLVHEVFLRLDRNHPDQWDNRRHFFGAVARSMQQYLVDHARHRSAKRRGGDRGKLSLTVIAGELASWDSATSEDLPGLIVALNELETESPRATEVARLRYILGLSIRQVSDITGMSERTTKKDWAFARSVLRRSLDRLG
jgi:RNA polymerase sigma factor (TIGR02999 family)